MSGDVLTTEEAPRREDVEGWRLHCLLEAGYPLELAEPLAQRRDVDLHKAVELITIRHCAPAVACAILL